MSGENTYYRLCKGSKYLMLFLWFCVAVFLSSCNEQAQGFALPEGDVERGKTTYKSLSCNECHSIAGIEWEGGADTLKIELGGISTKQKSYGELVTSVINPTHKIARRYKGKNANETTNSGISKMRMYNEIMTVQELIDLVAFLQSQYKVKVPRTEYYPYLY